MGNEMEYLRTCMEGASKGAVALVILSPLIDLIALLICLVLFVDIVCLSGRPAEKGYDPVHPLFALLPFLPFAMEWRILITGSELDRISRIILSPQLATLILWAVYILFRNWRVPDFSYIGQIRQRGARLRMACKNILIGVLQLRYRLRQIYRFTVSHKWIRLALCITFLVLAFLSFQTEWYSLMVILAISFLVAGIFMGLQSFLWFMFSWLLLIAFATVIAANETNDLNFIVAFDFLSLFVCLVYAAFTNYDVAKLATNVLNTITTLLILLVNILAGMASEEWAASIQFEVNVTLLPFVGIGYLTALEKDIQVYWERHYVDKGATGICRIEDWIYKPESVPKDEDCSSEHERRIAELEEKQRKIAEEIAALENRYINLTRKY